MRRSATYALLLALFVGACGSDKENVSNEPTLDSLETSFTADRFVNLFESLVLELDDECECNALPLSSDGDKYYDALLLLDLASSGHEFDQDCAIEHAQWKVSAASSCEDRIPSPSCKLMFGGQQEGQECSVLVDSIDDCALGLRCDVRDAVSDGTRWTGGTCRVAGTDICYADYECEAGVCQDSVCIAPEGPVLGESCADAPCIEGVCSRELEGSFCRPPDVCDLSPGWARKFDPHD